jgi:hypothetical protein
MSEKLAQHIARQIEEAFATTPYPGDDDIGWDGIEDVLRGKHWRELPLDVLYRERGELSFLTATGFRFYLPAFMLGVLRHYDEVDTLSGNLIASLCPDPQSALPDPHKRDTSGWLAQRTAQFSPDETEAVLAFLKSYRTLQPENFDEAVYSVLLDSALQFWEAKAHNNSTV